MPGRLHQLCCYCSSAIAAACKLQPKAKTHGHAIRRKSLPNHYATSRAVSRSHSLRGATGSSRIKAWVPLPSRSTLTEGWSPWPSRASPGAWAWLREIFVFSAACIGSPDLRSLVVGRWSLIVGPGCMPATGYAHPPQQLRGRLVADATT